jgi:hypothetical protein
MLYREKDQVMKMLGMLPAEARSTLVAMAAFLLEMATCLCTAEILKKSSKASIAVNLYVPTKY